jgi:hypothetical protein
MSRAGERILANVRFWYKADMPIAQINVRKSPDSCYAPDGTCGTGSVEVVL